MLMLVTFLTPSGLGGRRMNDGKSEFRLRDFVGDCMISEHCTGRCVDSFRTIVERGTAQQRRSENAYIGPGKWRLWSKHVHLRVGPQIQQPHLPALSSAQ